MTVVMSVINLKGGVGKTTTAVALAETLSAEHGKKVLVIDLDPQTNATVMLIGEKKWKELDDQNLTLAQLFNDALKSSDKFALDTVLQKEVSDVSSARTIDLLPSSLKLIDVQDELVNTPVGEFGATRPFDILWNAVRKIAEEYDFIIVDCPPYLGKITQNGLRMSQVYIIPAIPDVLSIDGIPQIVTRVRGFADAIGESIEPLGIAITRRRPVNLHRTTIDDLKRKHDNDPSNWPKVFGTEIHERIKAAEAAEIIDGEKKSLKEKWGDTSYSALTNEILESLRA